VAALYHRDGDMSNKNWDIVSTCLSSFSPTRHLDLVPQFEQNVRDLFAVPALDLDHALPDRPARAAGLLDLFRKRGHVRFGEDQVFDQHEAFPAAAFRVAVQVSGLLVRRQGLGGRFTLLFFAEIAGVGGPDGAGVGGGHGSAFGFSNSLLRVVEFSAVA